MKKIKNKIFIIGGASSVSKSSYGYNWCKHKITMLGSGFIREMAKSFLSKNNVPELYKHSFQTNLKNPIKI